MSSAALTMGLRPVPYECVMGSLLISSGDQIIPFIEVFVKRETPVSKDEAVMDIYIHMIF